MKTSSKILLGISSAGALAFFAVSCIEKANGLAAYHVTFDLQLTVNAALFLLPAAVFAAAALFRERCVKALIALGSVFAAVGIFELIKQKAGGSELTYSLLISAPYLAGAALFAAFAAAVEIKDKRKLSKVLLAVSGVSVLIFIVACVADFLPGLGRNGFDNILQWLTGCFLYGVFLLLPAAILAVVALFVRGHRVPLVIGAIFCALLTALMLLLKVLWIMTIPALVTAAVCVVLAVKAKDVSQS